MRIILLISIVLVSGGSTTSDCEDVGENKSSSIRDVGLVETGFLEFQGEEQVFTQFGEFKKAINGFSSRQSPNGLLVRSMIKKRLEITTIYYPEGQSYIRAEGFRYGKISGCTNRNISVKEYAATGNLVDFDLNRARKISDSGGIQQWRGVDDVDNGSGRTNKWEVKLEKHNNKLVPIEYNSREDQDGVGDGYTIYKRIVYKYSKKPEENQVDRINRILKDSNCKIY